MSGPGRSAAEVHDAPGQRMADVVDVRCWRSRSSDCVSGIVVREVSVRIGEMIASQTIHHRVRHFRRMPDTILFSGDQQDASVNMLDRDFGATIGDEVARPPRIGPGDRQPTWRP